jgi:putative effector of murein hydrolase
LRSGSERTASGTARAFQVNAEAGAFASLAFALHGMLAAILFPLGFWLWSLRAGS